MNKDQLERIKQRHSFLKKATGNVIYSELFDMQNLIEEVEYLQGCIVAIAKHHYDCKKHHDCSFVMDACVKGLRL